MKTITQWQIVIFVTFIRPLVMIRVLYIANGASGFDNLQNIVTLKQKLTTLKYLGFYQQYNTL